MLLKPYFGDEKESAFSHLIVSDLASAYKEYVGLAINY
jgi:hypothetical protein